MPREGGRRKMGCIVRVAEGKWRVIVRRGTSADGGQRNLSRVVYGTRQDAEVECARLASELSRSLGAGESITLSQYYWGIFRSAPSVRGEARSRSTLRGYDSQMRRFVLPMLGDRRVGSITHDQLRAAVLSAASPKSCKTALRAVMNAAYDDGLIDEKPFTRRIVTPQRRREQIPAWNAAEAAAALSALEGDPLEAYLILGLSGLRLEEALGVSPSDVTAQETYDIVTGETVRSLTVSVRRTYTDADGLREKTKTAFSARTVPVVVAGRDRLLEILAASRPEDPAAVAEWAASRLVPYRSDTLSKMWRRALERHGLRRITPDMLRHTSETMMQAAALPDTLVSRLHGHTDVRTDYRHYMRPDAAAAEMAAREVHKLMPPGR